MADVKFLDLEEPEGSGRKRGWKPKEPKQVMIPVPPPLPRPLSDNEIRRGVSNRARSAANLSVLGMSYPEIADQLDLKDAAEARRLTESVLANLYPVSGLETLRIVVTARAEKLFRQSMAMASADFLVDRDTGARIPNTDRLRWHQQAAADLMNYAAITGAKAPQKVEITPGEADYDAIVDRLMRRGGHVELEEADVIELEVLAVDDEDEDE